MSFGKGVRGALELGDDVTTQMRLALSVCLVKAMGTVSCISCSTEHSAAVTVKGEVYGGVMKIGRLRDENNHFKPSHMSTMSGNP